MKNKSSKKIIGVLGAGQLALFLNLKAQQLGFKLLTFSKSEQDPASLKKTLFRETDSSSSSSSKWDENKNKKDSQKKSFIKSSPLLTPTGWIQGDPNQPRDLRNFLNKVDILTFESEFFPADFIKKYKNKTQIAPSLKNLKAIQDRLSQKKLLKRYKFPILDFKPWDSLDPKKESFSSAATKALKTSSKNKGLSLDRVKTLTASSKDKSFFLGRVKTLKTSSKDKSLSLDRAESLAIPSKNKSLFSREKQRKALLKIGEDWGAFVLKTRQGGYDGYGTFVVKKKPASYQAVESSKQSLYKSKLKEEKLILPKDSFIAEPFLSFKRELAILSARNQKGQVIFFPLVESFQKNSVCLWVKGPVKHPKLPHLKRKIKEFLEKIDYRGVIAFELFETKSGKLILNELAPRVHNTGHYSLSAMTEDQFSIHLKAISNQNLKPVRPLSQEFAMLNLLGEGSTQATFKSKPLLDQSELLQKKGFHLYWYGKKDSRPGRKMGHINCLGKQSLEKLLKLRKQIKV